MVEKQANAQALLDTLPAQISAARSEHGTEQARLESGTIVRCVICQVNIDEVKAKGCGISSERCDLDAVRKRIEPPEFHRLNGMPKGGRTKRFPEMPIMF